MGATLLRPEVFLLWNLFASHVCGMGNFENVAFNKTCMMSSQYSVEIHPPGAAVNGNTNSTFVNTNNCIHTALNDTAPWWEVDLGRMYPVHRIVVWARTVEIDRMKGCVIYVDGTECGRFDTVPNRTTNFTCGSSGRIVRVSKNTTGIDEEDISMNICEVQVQSCSDDYWGSVCDRTCGNCSNGEVCDKVTGHCSSCPPGLQPPLCDTECAHGTFGHDCTQICSEGCEDVCDKVSGNCTCKPGWLGPACDAEAQTGDDSSTSGFLVGAVLGSVCALVVLVIVAVFLVRWLRSRSGVTKGERATDAGSHGTGSTQNSSSSNHRNPVTLSSIQSCNVYEAVEGEVNQGYVNSQQTNHQAEHSAIPADVLEVESSGELPMEYSAPSNDQPYEIVDRDREHTYEKPRMYVNTGDHHVYSDLNN